MMQVRLTALYVLDLGYEADNGPLSNSFLRPGEFPRRHYHKLNKFCSNLGKLAAIKLNFGSQGSILLWGDFQAQKT